MTETDVFDMICMFPLPPIVVASVKGLYPRCAGQLQSLESATLDVDNPEENILHTHFAVLLLFILTLRLPD